MECLNKIQIKVPKEKYVPNEDVQKLINETCFTYVNDEDFIPNEEDINLII
jgi:hypothetical protein